MTLPQAASSNVDDVVFRAVASGNVFEETVQRLAHAIKIGAVPYGEHFPPERELAPRLAVSRVTLREAIRALEQAGYVESRRGRTGGTFVIYRPQHERSKRTARRLAREMGPALLDALDFRRVVEPGAAELAAERADPAGAQRIGALARTAQEAAEGLYRGADAQFHLAIAELAGSPSVRAAVADLQMQLTDLLASIPRLERAIEHADVQHHAIVQAVGAGDAPAARTAMEEHIEATASLLRGFLA